MNDAIDLLRAKAEKAEARVAKIEKSLESAQSELSDLRTALRVMEGIVGGAAQHADQTGPSESVSKRQEIILALLGEGFNAGQSPANLFKIYPALSGEDINIETFRTSIWRMKDKVFDTEFASFAVKGESGVYWKERVVNLSAHDGLHDLLGDPAPKENEPHSLNAGGPYTREIGAPPPPRDFGNSPNWPRG